MIGMLEKELETYERNRAQLVGKAKGKYALVKESEIVSVFDSESDAIRAGYERFGNVPFLVKQIVEIETPENFTSNLMGV